MEVSKDIEKALDIIDYNYQTSDFRKVNIFPEYSLKKLKKLDGSIVLSKINSIEEIFEFLSLGKEVICFSDNKLDEYFIKLLFEIHKLDRKLYVNYVYEENSPLFKNSTFDIVKDSLDDKTRYFFEQVYKYCLKKNKNISKLVCKNSYDYEILYYYVKNYLCDKYKKFTNEKLEYWNLKEYRLYQIFKEKSFDIINLSYTLDKNVNPDIKKLLTDTGSLIGYRSTIKEDITGYDIKESRSILDPYKGQKEECKKDYMYVYNNKQ